MSRNKFLRRIYLEGCRIVDSFIFKSKDVFLQLKNIEEIHLEHNFITDKAVPIIEQIIFKNKMISRFQLSKNALSLKMLTSIEQALKFNREYKKYKAPDIAYFNYVEELQNSRKHNLNEDIEKLKERVQNLQYRQLIRQIAHREIETAKI